ncbi:MAG: hypothetical protein L6R36_007052 [Xanthoria steineri]|nr:MAG: hypothetical protein L6R36_007052 [Xanthoria steineri]
MQRSYPTLSTDFAAPTTSNPTLPSPQHARIATSDFCFTSEPSLPAHSESWSSSSTMFPLSQNRSDATEWGNQRRSITQRLFEKSWIQSTIGITTLLVTLIALFVYSHRGFVMAKWTEENDMLQACAQLIDVRSNATYPQCEEMLVTGPRPPPYNGKNIYKPGIGVHGYEKAATHHGQIDFLRPHVGRCVELHPHAIAVMALCAICALAAIPAISMLTRKRHGWKRGPLIPTTADGSPAAFRAFVPTPDQGCTDRPAPTVTIKTTQQPGRERVKEIRLRLRRRRQNIGR